MDIAEALIGFEFRGGGGLIPIGPANGPSAYAWSLWFNRYMVVVCTYIFESQYPFSVLV